MVQLKKVVQIMEKQIMKYFKQKLTLPSSLKDDRSTANLDEREMMQKHLEEYRAMKGDFFLPLLEAKG
jgi:hypothetical protein